MATSTFGKHFTLTNEKVDEFVHEMTQKVAPTLDVDFCSNVVCLPRDLDIKEKLSKALNR